MKKMIYPDMSLYLNVQIYHKVKYIVLCKHVSTVLPHHYLV
jgi:hypothetical protein